MVTIEGKDFQDMNRICNRVEDVHVFVAPTKLSEKIRSAGISLDKIDKTIDHALRRVIESRLTSKWTPRDCFLDTIKALGKLEAILLWVMILEGITGFSAPLSSSIPMERKAKVILLTKLSRKEESLALETLQNQSSVDEGEDEEGGDTTDRRTSPKSSSWLGEYPRKRKNPGTEV